MSASATKSTFVTVVDRHAAIKFLDLWVYLAWDSHFFGLVNRNDMFAITGYTTLKAKNRFPIPCREISTIAKRLVADFQARLAKYKQLQISNDEAYLYITLDVAELLRLGFSKLIITTCWTRAAADLNTADVGLTAIANIQTLIRDHSRSAMGRGSSRGNQGGGDWWQSQGSSSTSWDNKPKYNGDKGGFGGGGRHEISQGTASVMKVVGRQVSKLVESP